MKEMKRIMPYGSANFEEIATGNYYYIDKTKYIEPLERYKFPVFIRPRRFGKSLFTEMLRCYYDIRLKDRFQEIFGKLYIGKNPTGNQNKYFFLQLSFSGMEVHVGKTEDELKSAFDLHIGNQAYKFITHYKTLLNLSPENIEILRLEFKNSAINAICTILHKVAELGGQIYMVIDEYDSLTNALAIRYRYTDANDNMYLRILQKGGFFRNFFEMLKNETQQTIHQIYITGILPITISDMKSGFNIATWIHFEEEFATMLGITQTEFDKFIDEVYMDFPEITLNKDEVKATIKSYYNGYKFAKRSLEVYNPMMTLYILNSVTKYSYYPEMMADFNLRISYNQIAFLFGQNIKTATKLITDITEKKEIEFDNFLQVVFDMVDFKEGNFILEGLFYAGILTYSNTPNVLKIPNLVTYTFTLDYFAEFQNFKLDSYSYRNWISAYKRRGDVKTFIAGFFKDIIQNFLGQFFSNVNESYYHGLLFYVLHNHTERDTYETIPEYNLPNGRVDIMLKTYPNSMASIQLHDLFEIKQVGKNASDDELQKKLEEAKAQIISYKTSDYKTWRGIAVCFRGNKDYLMEIL